MMRPGESGASGLLFIPMDFGLDLCQDRQLPLD
jgi:hypothetical protein